MNNCEKLPTVDDMLKMTAKTVSEKCLWNLAPNMRISRIFQAEFFLKDLEKNQLTLSGVTKWKDVDPYEAATLRQKVTTSDGRTCSVEEFLLDLYAQSWSSMKGECDAAWRMYAHGSGWSLLRAETTVGKLLHAIADSGEFQIWKDENMIERKIKFDPTLSLAFGRVEYKDNDKDILKNEIYRRPDTLRLGKDLLFQKRTAFSYEEEVRLLFQRVDTKNKADDIYPGCFLHVKLNRPFPEVFDRILFAPKMPACQERFYRERFEKHGYKPEQMRRSDLYETPEFPVEISFASSPESGKTAKEWYQKAKEMDGRMENEKFQEYKKLMEKSPYGVLSDAEIEARTEDQLKDFGNELDIPDSSKSSPDESDAPNQDA